MFAAFDVGVGIFVLISAILATARGFTREVLSLATWAGSAAIAVYLWLYHQDLVYPALINDELVAQIALVIVAFIVSLIVLHLITMRIADFVVDSRIGPLDRSLGFIFGFARGVLIAVVVVIFGLWLLSGGSVDLQTRAENMIGQTQQAVIDAPPADAASVNAALEGLRSAVASGDDATIRSRISTLESALLALGPNRQREIIERSSSRLPDWVASSRSLPVLDGIGRWLIAQLPDNLEKQVNDFLQRRSGDEDNLADVTDNAAGSAAVDPNEATDLEEDGSPPAE